MAHVVAVDPQSIGDWSQNRSPWHRRYGNFPIVAAQALLNKSFSRAGPFDDSAIYQIRAV